MRLSHTVPFYCNGTVQLNFNSHCTFIPNFHLDFIQHYCTFSKFGLILGRECDTSSKWLRHATSNIPQYSVPNTFPLFPQGYQITISVYRSLFRYCNSDGLLPELGQIPFFYLEYWFESLDNVLGCEFHKSFALFLKLLPVASTRHWIYTVYSQWSGR